MCPQQPTRPVANLKIHFSVRPSPLTLFTIMIYQCWHLRVALLYDLADYKLAFHSHYCSSSRWLFTHTLWRVLPNNFKLDFLCHTHETAFNKLSYIVFQGCSWQCEWLLCSSCSLLCDDREEAQDQTLIHVWASK